MDFMGYIFIKMPFEGIGINETNINIDIENDYIVLFG